MREINTKKLFERIDWYCKDRQEGERSCQMNGSYTPPSNVADWLALNKSRPVDPPRERDYAKLTEAAKRKEAPFVDWNGPSSDPCLKYAGIGGGGKPEAPAEEVRTSAAAPAPAPVADSLDWDSYDKRLGLRADVGDIVVWPWGDIACRVPWLVEEVDGDYLRGKSMDGYETNCGDYQKALAEPDGQCGALRILKRKNVAARAWKHPLNGQICLLIGDHGYTKSGKIGQWADAGTRGPCQGNRGEEIHDPAEIQRLVAELHAAGLGK